MIPKRVLIVYDFEGGGAAQIAFGRFHRNPWGEATRFLPLFFA